MPELVASRDEVISLGEVAQRFSKARGLDATGYSWMRKPPGRGGAEAEEVGNSLGVQKAVRAFNTANSSSPIDIYKTKGYDGTPRTAVVMRKADIIRLKGYILRAAKGPGRRGRTRREATPFQIIGKLG